MIPSTKPVKRPESDESAKGTATDPKKGQIGEGSYEGTRDYQKSVKDYLQEADVQRDAKAARPSSAAEASELERAEKEARSHSRAPGK